MDPAMSHHSSLRFSAVRSPKRTSLVVHQRLAAPQPRFPRLDHYLRAATLEIDLGVTTSIGPNWADKLCTEGLAKAVHFLPSFSLFPSSRLDKEQSVVVCSASTASPPRRRWRRAARFSIFLHDSCVLPPSLIISSGLFLTSALCLVLLHVAAEKR
jgi:hypothetical protein